jgi:hypothetical protein
MNVTMDRARAIEIIAAYSADDALWPAAERDALHRLAERDAEVRQALREAEALDMLIGAWAEGGPADDRAAAEAAAEAVLRRAVAERHRSPPQRWLPVALGGSIAAALVAAVTLLPGAPQTTTAPARVAQTQDEATQLAAAVDNQMWSMTFTATPDEESVL